MTTREISDLLGVSKTFLYRLQKDFPAEVPKNKTDLWRWEEFVHRHRVEPTGDLRVQRAPSIRISKRK